MVLPVLEVGKGGKFLMFLGALVWPCVFGDIFLEVAIRDCNKLGGISNR